jgi:hypothetical protein
VSLEVSHTKDNQISRSFSQKTRGNMVILHISLVCVLSRRIAFILGRREYTKYESTGKKTTRKRKRAANLKTSRRLGAVPTFFSLFKNCNPTPCSLGLSATSQQYFSLRTNQPAVLFSQNKPAPAISHQPNEQAASLQSVVQTW